MKLDTINSTAINRTEYQRLNTLWENAYHRAVITIVSHVKLQLLRYEIHLERKTLAKLSDHQLEDIGIRREDAAKESRKKYRDIPRNRTI